MEDICALSVDEIKSALSAKKFSCAELTKAVLDKIERQKELNTFITLSHEYALQRAKEADGKIARREHAPLLGIPVAIKDMILTEGILSTAASKMLSNFVAPYSATCVRKLEQAGAIVVGKTNMDEFAMGSSNENSAFGTVKNPWHLDYVPGGSSGGSAAAVAARQLPLALGTDTGGSIRQPASYCGISGLKPTYGRVSRYGVIAFASSLDQVGAFAGNVRDLAYAIQVIAGHDHHDSTSVKLDVPDFFKSLGESVKDLRIGIPREYFVAGLDPEVNQAVRNAIDSLAKLGAHVVDISLPNTEAAIATYYIIAPAEASSNLARYDGIRYGHRTEHAKDLDELYARSRAEGFGPEVKRRIMIGSYVLSAGYFDAYYLRAQKVRTLIAGDFRKAFEKQCDVILAPTAPTTAFKIGAKVEDPLAMYLNDIFTIPVNLAGLPGMSIPCGFSKAGLPIGLHLIGKPWDEATLFKVAAAYETATQWHKQLPEYH